MQRKRGGGSFRRLVILVALAGAVVLGLTTFRAGPRPEISAASDLPGIGKRTRVQVSVAEPRRGLSEVRVEFVQGERTVPLASRSYTPLPPWAFWGERTKRDELTVEVGSQTLEGIVEGPAAIRVVAARAGTWLRSPAPALHELRLEVKLRPPSLQVLSSATHVAQGGCEAVVYLAGPSTVRDGVRAGEWWFPGFALPGGDGRQRFALFAAPYDLDDPRAIELIAEDDVGNLARAAFLDTFEGRPFSADTIEVTDQFLARVVPAILAQTPEIDDRGSLLDTYVAINGELRQANSRTLVELARTSVQEFLWSRPFVPLRNAQVMSAFADRRTYRYGGRTVDRQDHLGFDLASTRMAEVPAANDGVVLIARYFGIYGNTVVLDHGYGLMSLYGHLSSFAVEEGQRVTAGRTLGRTGDTGLAGGDHLHFTMLLQGLPVNPKEWWDGHWIHDRLALKLGPALRFTQGPSTAP